MTFYERASASVSASALGDEDEFKLIDSRAKFPEGAFDQFIDYAMKEGRCDLIEYWVAGGLCPGSSRWLETAGRVYHSALLPVIPLLLAERPLTLAAADSLLGHEAVRPLLANYLHAFEAHQLVNLDFERCLFLEKLFDLSDPRIIVAATSRTTTEHLVSGVPEASASAEYLTGLCADRSARETLLSSSPNEVLAVTARLACFPASQRPLREYLEHDQWTFVNTLVRGGVTADRSFSTNARRMQDLALRLVKYEGEQFTEIIAFTIGALIGNYCDIRGHPEVSHWIAEPDNRFPIAWLTRYRPADDHSHLFVDAPLKQCLRAFVGPSLKEPLLLAARARLAQLRA